jgi:peptidoglycan/xylan/chitin deacetylase (PgdA/CDA1 family)
VADLLFSGDNKENGMVKGVAKRYIELAIVVIAVACLILIAGNYYHYDKSLGITIESTTSSLIQSMTKKKVVEKCPPGWIRIQVPDGYLFREKAGPSLWLKIFDTFPLSGKGKERVYRLYDEGSEEKANQNLKDMYQMERFKPVKIKHITWTEDPFKAKYWRYDFYSLRETRHLLATGKKTGDTKYYKKALEIATSFVDNGMDKPHSWDDYHTVAFRSMSLVNLWWKLREAKVLSATDSTKILKALKVHGDFLQDSNHYDAQHNHGINESIALYSLAVNFPEMPGSKAWLSVARNRLDTASKDLIDDDGALVENSPYYHFYILQKFWDLYHYSKLIKVPISFNFDSRFKKMISYATYILQPNLEVPLVGASLRSEIHNDGVFSDIAAQDPYFRYVLSQGKDGQRPPKLNVFFPSTGETILRSAWGDKKDFKDQTQVIFDVGPYRTTHSHLDALSFSLYAAGKSLMPDAGLYSYVKEPLKSYFIGTRAHNTVVVDGKNQKKGAAEPVEFIEGKGFSMQTASHELYDGVTHKRTIALLDKSLVLIVDNLESKDKHKYEQMFHLNPGVRLVRNGLRITTNGSSPNESLTIHQLQPDGLRLSVVKGQQSPPDGLISYQYEKLVPDYSLAYSISASNASFITLVEIGEANENLTTSLSKSKSGIRNLTIDTGKSSFSISIKEEPKTQPKVDVEAPSRRNVPVPTILEDFSKQFNWTLDDTTGAMFLDRRRLLGGKPTMRLITSTSGEPLYASRKLDMDLSNKNLSVRMLVNNPNNLDSLNIKCIDMNGYVATNFLKSAYTNDYNGDWLTVSLGTGYYRDKQGEWSFTDRRFMWRKIKGIEISANSKKGTVCQLSFGAMATIPAQKTGAVVICFDDGHGTILHAFNVMKKYGVKGNIAVIADRPEQSAHGYLTLNQLKNLQNNYGWNLVNHSAHHKNAVLTYYNNNKLEDYRQDVLDGAKYLLENGLNTAPNWYIYPNGATNNSIKRIIGKYYSFARTVRAEPEVFPFGDNLDVKDFNVNEKSTAVQVHNALKDAKLCRQTLILTFHRIWTGPPSSPLPKSNTRVQDFETIIKDIKYQGIPVLTFSELDRLNNIPENKISFDKGNPARQIVRIEAQQTSVFDFWQPAVLYSIVIIAFIIIRLLSRRKRLADYGNTKG